MHKVKDAHQIFYRRDDNKVIYIEAIEILR